MRFLKMNNKNWKRLCIGEVQAKQLEINFKEVGGNMKFETGQKIKISRHEGTKKTEENFKIRIGTIYRVNDSHITVQFKNYRESFSIGDFQNYKIEIRNNKKWVQLQIK